MKIKINLKNNSDFFRFLIVGGTATLIDFTIYILLNNKMGIIVSKSLSMLCSCIYSFFMNRTWTFKVESRTSILQIVKYIISQLINISINTITNTIIYNLTGDKILSFIVATGFAMIINYLLQKLIVFKEIKK